MKKNLYLILTFLFLISGIFSTTAQTTEKRVILQTFWWDYHNNNFPNGWANYLTELAPRLKSLGIDAVWIPPSYKNTGTNSVGYAPFDHYDLGDKYQKGNTETRFGTKDEFLRMVAVMHANGIEVIQDIVLNHVTGAGATNGAGGQDSSSLSILSDNGFKNFRYVCYATPASASGGGNATQYLSRQGRWPKNYTNFHPHAGHNTQNDDWTSPFWGPDFCYGYQEDGTGNGFGLSGNATCSGCYNPSQTSGYNRNQARAWLQWFTKQTDIDGFRWDAVKHYPHFVVQDLSYNVKYLNGWANRGELMLNFGEYVGGGSTLDNYVNAVAASNSGSEKLLGTKDFGLRGALYGIVAGNGGYDLSQVAGTQQTERVTYYSNSNTWNHFTVPFINNHDTYRPTFSANGDINGWNTSEELAPHIDRNDPRVGLIYALAFALDGNPLIFFEDLFNISNTGKRFTHQPTSTTDLPQSSDIENITWAHQALDFKNGPYKVRGHSGNSSDHLIIERGGKAIVSINDSWSNWQSDWVDSDFPPGTILKDYGNSNGNNTTTVQNDQRVQISTPPCDGSANRRGYAIWAPLGQDNNAYAPDRNVKTTQEWEMADDLGDSHCLSLGQGGRLPDNSTTERTVGKIFSAANKKIDIEVFGENNTNSLTLMIYTIDGNLLFQQSATSPLVTDYTAPTTDWYVLKIKNTTANYTGQKCWVKVSYTAPTTVNTSQFPSIIPETIWTGIVSTNWHDCRNWLNGIIPNNSKDAIIRATATNMPLVTSDAAVKKLTIENGAFIDLDGTFFFRVNDDLVANGQFNIISGCPKVVFQRINGVAQYLSGNLNFCEVHIKNPTNVFLENDMTISSLLKLERGKLVLNGHSLTLAPTSIITDMNTERYIVCENEAISISYLVQTYDQNSKLFPIGTENSYTPITLFNDASIGTAKVRVFENVYQLGNQGLFVENLDSVVQRTWTVERESGNVEPMVQIEWTAAAEGNHFKRDSAILMAFNNNEWGEISATKQVNNELFSITSEDYSSNYSMYSIAHNYTSTPIDTSGNGGNPVDSTTFKLYPNPTTGQITLKMDDSFDSENDELTVIVYSIDGKLAFRATGLLDAINEALDIHFPRLYRGVYVFEIAFYNEKRQVKVVKY